MMPADSVEGELERLKGVAPITRSEEDNAGRALARMQGAKNLDTTSREVVDLYVALRRVRGENCRINAAQLLGWSQRLQQPTTVKRKFFLVPKSNIEDGSRVKRLISKYISWRLQPAVWSQ